MAANLSKQNGSKNKELLTALGDKSDPRHHVQVLLECQSQEDFQNHAGQIDQGEARTSADDSHEGHLRRSLQDKYNHTPKSHRRLTPHFHPYKLVSGGPNKPHLQMAKDKDEAFGTHAPLPNVSLCADRPSKVSLCPENAAKIPAHQENDQGLESMTDSFLRQAPEDENGQLVKRDIHPQRNTKTALAASLSSRMKPKSAAQFPGNLVDLNSNDETHGQCCHFQRCGLTDGKDFRLVNIVPEAVAVQTKQVGNHQPRPSGAQWQKLDNIGIIRPFHLRDCMRNDENNNLPTVQRLGGGGQEYQEIRHQRLKTLLPMGETMDLGSENDPEFGEIKTSLDQLLLHKSTADGEVISHVDDTTEKQEKLAKPVEPCEKVVSMKESSAHTKDNIANRLATGVDRAMPADVEVMSLSQPMVMHQVNSVLTLLEQLPVGHQIAYFNDRIRMSLTESPDCKGKDAILRQLLAVFSFYLLRSQQMESDHQGAVRSHLYTLDVVKTLVNCVCEKYKLLQISSTACWLLAFLIMEPFAALEDHKGRIERPPETASEIRQDFLQQFLASQGAKFIANSLQEDSLPDLTFMNVSINLALPIVALASAPLGRAWLEQNCRDHISEYKSLLIHKKSVLDMIQVVCPLMNQEAVDRIVDEFVSFAETVEAKDRERNLAELLEEEEQDRIKREQRKKKKRQKKQGRSKKTIYLNPGADGSSEDEQPPAVPKIQTAPMSGSENTATAFNIGQEHHLEPPTNAHIRNRDSFPVSELAEDLPRSDAAVGVLKEQRVLSNVHGQDHFPDDFPPITRATLNKTPDVADKGWVKVEGRCHTSKCESFSKGQSVPTEAHNKPLRWADVARIGCSNIDRKSHLTVLSNGPDVSPKASFNGKSNDGSGAFLRPNGDESIADESRIIDCGYNVTPPCENHGNDIDLTQSSDNESDDETQSSSSECPHFLFSPSLYPRRMGSKFGANKSSSVLKEVCPGVGPVGKNATDCSLRAWPSLNCLKKTDGGSESMPCLWEDTKTDDHVFPNIGQGTKLNHKAINKTDVNKDIHDIIRLTQVGNLLHRTRSMDVMDIDNCSKRKYQRPLTQADSKGSSTMSDQNLKGLLISDSINAPHPNIEHTPAASCFHGTPRIEPFTNLPPLKGRSGSPDKTRSLGDSWKLRKLCSEDSNGEIKTFREVNDKARFRSKSYSTSCANVLVRPGYKSFTFFPSACNIPQLACDQTAPPMATSHLNSSAAASQMWTRNHLHSRLNHTSTTSTLENDVSPPKTTNDVAADEPNALNSSDKDEFSVLEKSTTSIEVPVSFQTFDDNLQIWQSSSNVAMMCRPGGEKAMEELTLQQLKEIWQKDYNVTTLSCPSTSISVASKTNTRTPADSMEAISQLCIADQAALPTEQSCGTCPFSGQSEFCHQQSLRPEQKGLSFLQAPSDFQTKEKLLLNSCLNYPSLSRQAESVEFDKPSLKGGLPREKLLFDNQHKPEQKCLTKQFGPWQPLGNPARTPLLQLPMDKSARSASANIQQHQECFQRPSLDHQDNVSPPVLFPEDLQRTLNSPTAKQGLFPAFHDSRAGDFLNELFTDSLFVDKIAVNQLRQKIRSSWTNIPSSDITVGVLRDSVFLDDLDYYASIYGVKIRDILKGPEAETMRQAYSEETGLIPNQVPATATCGAHGKTSTSKQVYEGGTTVWPTSLTFLGPDVSKLATSYFPPVGQRTRYAPAGYTTDGRESAVLILDKRQFHIDAYRLEVLRSPELEHHFLLRSQGSGENGQAKYIAFQLFEYNLIEYLQLLSLSSNQETSTLNGLSWQLLEGLNFIHLYLGIAHGNLKPSWIFLDAEGSLRLGGFCLEPVKSGDDFTSQNPATSGDDVMKDKSKASFESDVQMAGILIYYILTKGLHPFSGSSVDMKVDLTRENLIADQHLGEETFDLLSGMIFLGPDLRPSADQCLKHPFFWSAERKFRLILLVGSDVLTEMKTGVALTGCGAPTMMEILGLVDINEVSPNWVQEVNMTVMKEMRSFRVYKNNLSELALFIYNCCLHFDKLSNVAKDVLDEPCKYFLTLFPCLFMAIYRSLKSSDRVQRTCYRPFFS